MQGPELSTYPGVHPCLTEERASGSHEKKLASTLPFTPVLQGERVQEQARSLWAMTQALAAKEATLKELGMQVRE